MKQLIVLIGLPASGKSTYMRDVLYSAHKEYRILSRDMLVEHYAKLDGITYNEAFTKYGKDVDKAYKEHMRLIRLELPDVLFVDKTNLYSHVRDREYQFFLDKGYCITYIFFTKPKFDEEFEAWQNRINSRPGKVIPKEVQKKMYEDYLEDVPTDAKVRPHFKFWINNWKGVRDG